jgi:hypothetical protein
MYASVAGNPGVAAAEAGMQHCMWQEPYGACYTRQTSTTQSKFICNQCLCAQHVSCGCRVAFRKTICSRSRSNGDRGEDSDAYHSVSGSKRFELCYEVLVRLSAHAGE